MKKKRIVSIIFTLLIVLISILPVQVFGSSEPAQQQNADSSAAGESTATSAKWNVMLLIDKSGSMQTSDAERKAIAAAKLFVDELSSADNSEVASYTDLGIMTFALETEKVTEFASMKSAESREYAKAMIDGIKYMDKGTGGTDLGVAVEAATKQLDAYAEEGDRNMVVLFTDGWTENVENPEKSKQSLNKGFETAKALGAEIFVVGWNNGGNTIPAKGIEEIQYIANTAQLGDGVERVREGDKTAKKLLCNYLITNDWNSVRSFYTAVHAGMSGSEVEEIQDGVFHIESAEIVEVEVISSRSESHVAPSFCLASSSRNPSIFRKDNLGMF